ncbi:hypothetical protein F7725_005679 [Dissostichus mawsoni]|uniref:Uncharacterized protein n=1 Tax=Dissostichus mawsoni TaxID=36200 RepID=A0A7J5YRZ2_DISMA|nr:hypothetical protein F7725_005679 [Dissostichus mawsoni]
MVSLEEEPELSMIYENFEDVSARKAASRRSVEDFKVPAAAPETMRLVVVSFGLLCVLQAALNISLSLSFYSYGRGMQEFEGEDLGEEEAVLLSWKESRDDCQQRDADLIIINSKKNSYWQDGEPNKYEGKDEDCGEIRFYEKENNCNEVQCELQRFWICEKVMAL